MKPEQTKPMWICWGQFHCDEHKAGIQFFFAPLDAECAECSGDSPKSYLTKEGAAAMTTLDERLQNLTPRQAYELAICDIEALRREEQTTGQVTAVAECERILEVVRQGGT